MSGQRTVMVTGAGSGIGRATARAYLDAGATVHGLDLRPGELDPGPGRWVPHVVDVADAEAVRAVAADTLAADGAVDVLVTSAALGYPEPFTEMTVESWDRVWRVNVTGTMLCLQAVLPGMIERRTGSIVIVSSIAGRTRSVSNGAHYTTSKYGVIGLTRHLAAELAGTGVRINCVAPGPTNSPILTAHASTEEQEAIAARTPLRRIAQPEDVAEVITFVAGDAARHVHGAVLDVNGGLY
ncbi:SDR family NAD(P)-dependent oxidoreductase [Desertihabitans brevis]|uniref:SDR family NAD(P)-dependent oxidoreductase n=1 Tax=Desertihabitans brevis TaxID=2268447 RepID=A0A367YSV5_9ACTN|nr:SDR family NAD(P)-dependent oxidoreductase [Desertihabitans brevis]RCK68963.1 SDR family NAD(P)-dependent oxidoreductase [Desertihabitans brevis]